MSAQVKTKTPLAKQSDLVEQAFAKLLDVRAAYDSEAGLDKLKRAYLFGRSAHDGQSRESGEPYFTHPLRVAHLLAEMRLDTDTLVTALLHDTVEDCEVTLKDIATEFGENVAMLVDGVTKLSRLELQSVDTKQAENFRKFVLAVGKDIRVLLVKLADRTHNMQTLQAVSNLEKRRRIATETMEIYAPLAERMGITRFQTELEDLSFEILQPEMRDSIISRLEFLAIETESVVPKICAELQSLLAEKGILCEVTGRRKTPYSISRKMQVKNVTMDQLSDVMAFRIIVQDVASCYQTLGCIHTAFPVVMGRFKDYISTPKTNGYQSLHTGVIGPMRQKIEIQIRTEDMDDTAERGVAAHWDYKESSAQPDTDQERQARLETFRWARELVSLLELNEEATEFLENTKLEMYQDKVFCFTPKGDLISLPKGATAIDFAYAVHTDVGDRCVGVLINDKRRQLTTELVNGDQVSIITEKDASPRSDWEDFAKTGRARSAIKRFIRLQKQEEFARVGKVLLEREYRFRKTKFKEQLIDEFLSAFNASTRTELYAHIAEAKLKAKDVFDRLHPDLATTSSADKASPVADTPPEPLFHVDRAHEGLAVHLGKCCHPLPGDKIVGIVTTGKGVTVHTKNCNTLAKFVEIPELWLNVDWPRGAGRRYAGRIQAVVVNEPGALAALCTVIGQQAGNITHIQLTERDMNFFTFILDIDVKNLEHIHSIIAVLRSNKYIESVERRGL